MGPLGFLVRIAGLSVMAWAGLTMLARKKPMDSTDLVESAIHFRNGFNEFSKGFTTILFGSEAPTPEESKRKKEASRIEIE